MRLWAGSIPVTVSFWFFALLAACILMGREALLFYMFLPVLVHECGHFLCMLLCGVKIEAVALEPFAVSIVRDRAATTGYARDILISLGGALANACVAAGLFLFAFPSMRMRYLVAANLGLALFHMLPIGTLDGGQVLRLVLERFGSLGAAYRISRICSFVFLILLFAAVFFLCLQGGQPLPLLIACAYLAGCVIFSPDR